MKKAYPIVMSKYEGYIVVYIPDFKKAPNKSDVQADGEIFCPARQKFAGIPMSFQEFGA